MENTGGGILGRVGEKILAWIALGLLIFLGVGIYQLGSDGRQALWNGIWRTGVWLVIVIALPWSGRLFMARILEIGSNWAGVTLVAAFVVVDLVAGLVLMGGLPTGGWSWVAALTALGVAGAYNFMVAEYLAEQVGG